MKALVSKAYAEQLRKLHESRRWGAAGASHLPAILPMCAGVKTLLDYGCGRGTLKPALAMAAPHVSVTEYDPGIPGKDTVPKGVFDLVVATDVMEHVEPDFVEPVLEHIAARTGVEAYLLISFTPSNALLPDGRNSHLTIAPATWWRRKLRKVCGRAFTYEWDEAKSVAAITLERRRCIRT